MKKELIEIKNMQDFKIYLNYPRIPEGQNGSGLFEKMSFNTCDKNPESMISWFKNDNILYQIRVSKECLKHIEKPRYGIGGLPMMCVDLSFKKITDSGITKNEESTITIEILMPNELSEKERSTESFIKEDDIYDNFFEDEFEPVRVNKYLKENNISLKTLNALCDYLHQNKFSLNSKLNEEDLSLIDKNISTTGFNNWLHTKLTYEKAKIDNAKNIIKNLSYGSKIGNTIVGIEESESKNKRILNALQFLIDVEYYNEEKKAIIQSIINSDKVLKTKINQLKNHFHEKSVKNSQSENRAEHDPYENFHWGGLSGEEAHTAYWNCD